jgi:hypothetical protein
MLTMRGGSVSAEICAEAAADKTLSLPARSTAAIF